MKYLLPCPSMLLVVPVNSCQLHEGSGSNGSVDDSERGLGCDYRERQAARGGVVIAEETVAAPHAGGRGALLRISARVGAPGGACRGGRVGEPGARVPARIGAERWGRARPEAGGWWRWWRN